MFAGSLTADFHGCTLEGDTHFHATDNNCGGRVSHTGEAMQLWVGMEAYRTRTACENRSSQVTFTRASSRAASAVNQHHHPIRSFGLFTVGHFYRVRGSADSSNSHGQLNHVSSVLTGCREYGLRPALPMVTIQAVPATVREGSAVTVTVVLSAPRTAQTVIPITLTRDTSEEADHGVLASITIPANVRSGSSAISTAQDTDTDDEQFTLALGTVPATVQAGTPSSVTVTIEDDDAPPPLNPVVTYNEAARDRTIEHGDTITATVSGVTTADITRGTWTEWTTTDCSGSSESATNDNAATLTSSHRARLTANDAAVAHSVRYEVAVTGPVVRQGACVTVTVPTVTNADGPASWTLTGPTGPYTVGTPVTFEVEAPRGIDIGSNATLADVRLHRFSSISVFDAEADCDSPQNNFRRGREATDWVATSDPWKLAITWTPTSDRIGDYLGAKFATNDNSISPVTDLEFPADCGVIQAAPTISTRVWISETARVVEGAQVQFSIATDLGQSGAQGPQVIGLTYGLVSAEPTDFIPVNAVTLGQGSSGASYSIDTRRDFDTDDDVFTVTFGSLPTGWAPHETRNTTLTVTLVDTGSHGQPDPTPDPTDDPDRTAGGLTPDDLMTAFLDGLGRESDIPTSTRRDSNRLLAEISSFVCGPGGLTGTIGPDGARLFGVGEVVVLAKQLLIMAQQLATAIHTLKKQFESLCELRRQVNELRDIKGLLNGLRTDDPELIVNVTDLSGQLADYASTVHGRESGSVTEAIDDQTYALIFAEASRSKQAELIYGDGDDDPLTFNVTGRADTEAERDYLDVPVDEYAFESAADELRTQAPDIEWPSVDTTVPTGTAAPTRCVAAPAYPDNTDTIANAFRAIRAKATDGWRRTPLGRWFCGIQPPAGEPPASVCLGTAAPLALGPSALRVEFHPRYCVTGDDAADYWANINTVIAAVVLMGAGLGVFRMWFPA